MASSTGNIACRVGFFTSVPPAEQAVRNLLAAGFSEKELAVICPERFKTEFAPHIQRAQPPGAQGAEKLAEGGVVGATIGGIALAATAIATGGVGLLAAIPVLIGGGAFAGAFSNLVLADGYGKGIGEYFNEAVHKGKIVVGVEVDGEDATDRLVEAERVLRASGASLPAPKVK